ncbi:ANK [Seminavis robusta]|uniref:ANK n=1 Tax=Seminavis robusta TaxID=568900 RepID=A0A9N8HAD6_9STRA|nr:ANK [Seminavis robusta]|eukprot:Sro315_g115400.1 ANK (316) ;mRNA; r:64969-65916
MDNSSSKSPERFDLPNNFFVMDNTSSDNHSETSSTMSDDASWLSDNEEPELDESERNEMEVEAAHAVAKMVRERSTASLGAYLRRDSKTTSSGRAAPNKPFARTASMANFGVRPKPSMAAIQKVSAQEASTPGDSSAKPSDHLCTILETQLDRVPFAALGDYFLKTTPEHIAAWDAELLRTVRTQDLPLLKKMHQAGARLQASNQFGESILHVCVRRGTPAILHYLLQQGQVSPRVHCDYGRTPLHDAFWTFTNEPNSVQMIALLLKQCPEMLLVTDKRGFTPLDYVPRNRWGDCCRLLDRCVPLLNRLKNNGRC